MVVRCFSWSSSTSTVISRFIENIVFGLSSAFYLLFSPHIQVIHSNTWPIIASGLMSLVARMRRIPYVVRVVDLYPESIASQKRSGIGRVVIGAMRGIDRWIANGAALWLC